MLALGKFLTPGTIVVCGNRKSCLKIYCKTMRNIFAASFEKERLNFLPLSAQREGLVFRYALMFTFTVDCRTTTDTQVAQLE